MRYSWTIDQKAIKDSGLDLDIIQYSIIRLFADFALSRNCKTMQADGKTWYWFHWSLVRDQMPILGLKGRSSVMRRIKMLKELGLLEGHQSNQVSNSAWYCFGEAYDNLIFFKKQDVQNRTAESIDIDTPVHNDRHNNTNKDNTNKDNTTIYRTSVIEIPSLKDCINYCNDNHLDEEFALQYFNYNESKGWTLGNTDHPIKNWRADMTRWAAMPHNKKFKIKNAKPYEQTLNGHLITDEIPEQKRGAYISKVALCIARLKTNPAVTNHQRREYEFLDGQKLIDRFKADHPNLFRDMLKEYHKQIVETL